MGELCAPVVRGVAGIREAGIRVIRKVSGEGARLLANCRRRARREGQDVGWCPGLVGWRIVWRRLFDDDMRVGAPEPERAHAGQPGQRARGPRNAPVGNREAQRKRGEAWIELLEVEVRRDHLVVKRQNHLDEPGHSGRCLEVADVGLDRSHVDPFSRLQGFLQRPKLDHIAKRSARSMRLDVRHPMGVDPRVGERFVDHLDLGGTVGSRETVAHAVLADRRAAQQRQDAVPAGLRVLETLEDHDAAALAADVSIGAGVEGLAAALG